MLNKYFSYLSGSFFSLGGKLSHASRMLLQAKVPNPLSSRDRFDDDHTTAVVHGQHQ